MDLKLLYSLMTVFIFCPVTKSYSQREIHPLEPMFTYDYALKYCSHLSIIDTDGDYWFIDNFKAPVGVETIQNNRDFYYPVFNRERVTAEPNYEKKIFNYNSATGYLQQSLYLKSLKRDNKFDTLQISTYKYSFENEKTIVEVITKDLYGLLGIGDIYTEKSNSSKYIFENGTGLLINRTSHIRSSFREKGDTTATYYYNTIDSVEYVYTYNEFNIKTVNKISTVRDNDGKITNIEREYSNCRRESSAYIESVRKRDSLNYTVLIGDKAYVDKNRSNIDIVRFRRGTTEITLSQDHIYYELTTDVERQRRKGLFLFNKDKSLTEYRFSNQDWFYQILSKKTDRRWHIEGFNPKKNSFNYAKTSHNKFWVKDRSSKTKRKGYTIYLNNHPSLIYKYD